MSESGLLEREITLTLDLNLEAEKILRRALNDAKSGKYNSDFLIDEYHRYALSKKYAHCHFITVMMSRISKELSKKYAKENSSNYILSQYHYAWYLIREGNDRKGWEELKVAANRGHIFAKKEYFYHSKSAAQKLIFFPYYIYLIALGASCIIRNKRVYTVKDF